MKTIILTLMFVLGTLTLSAQSSSDAFARRYGVGRGIDQSPAYVAPKLPNQQLVTLFNGEVVTEDKRRAIIIEIEGKVARLSENESPYKKFANGTVFYIGKILYQLEGIIPKPEPTGEYMFIRGSFKVLDVTKEGCRIKTGDDDIFIEGLSGLTTDGTYNSMMVLRRRPNMTYTTVLNASRTIERWELAEDATKEEYLTYCKEQESKIKKSEKKTS